MSLRLSPKAAASLAALKTSMANPLSRLAHSSESTKHYREYHRVMTQEKNKGTSYKQAHDKAAKISQKKHPIDHATGQPIPKGRSGVSRTAAKVAQEKYNATLQKHLEKGKTIEEAHVTAAGAANKAFNDEYNRDELGRFAEK